MDYNYPNKRQYRRTLWNFIEECVPNKDRHVLFLDSAQGLETKFLLDRGWKPELLHPCNRNVAEAAVISRRMRARGYPIKSLGCDIFDAIERLHNIGTAPGIIDLDFTCPIGSTLCEKLLDTSDAGLFPPRTVVAITVMRGREKQPWFSEEQAVHAHSGEILSLDDIRRDALTIYTMGGDNTGVGAATWGVYKSTSGQTFLWSACVLLTPHTARNMEDRLLSFFDKVDSTMLGEVSSARKVANKIRKNIISSGGATIEQKNELLQLECTQQNKIMLSISDLEKLEEDFFSISHLLYCKRGDWGRPHQRTRNTNSINNSILARSAEHQGSATRRTLFANKLGVVRQDLLMLKRASYKLVREAQQLEITHE